MTDSTTKPTPWLSRLSLSKATSYNPIATHGFCFLLGVTAMAYTWPDREAASSPQKFKKGQVYIWLNPKHLTLPDPLLPIPYVIGKKAAAADVCLVATTPVTLAPGPGQHTVKVSFPHTKKTEALVTALRQKKPLVAIPADHHIQVDPCNASVLRVEYGS